MIFEGDKSVIDAIKEKKRLVDAGEEYGHIKPLLFVDGGLMKGVYSAGAVVALEELGYSETFTTAVGVSSGAPTLAYFLAKSAHVGVTIYSEEVCDRKFINPRRFWRPLETDYFTEVLRGVTGKKLNVEAILKSKTEFYSAVANFETGEPELITSKSKEGLLSSIQASILMPNISNEIVRINDIRYVDGGFTRPHALQKVLEVCDFTHLLVITNQNKTITTIPWLERFLDRTLYRHRMPAPLRFAAHERKRERMKVLETLKQADTPHAVIWGDHSIDSLEFDVKKVLQVVEASRQWWTALLLDDSEKNTPKS